tara:strand:- start:26838 stop:27584 length:747 start_codon:yes stop_codon:yes gene_type:complete
MNLIFVTLLLSSVVSFAANKVVQKARVVDEKVVAAEGCSITGDYTNAGYTTTEYKYTVTMKVKLLQKQELYNVNVKKPLFGKLQETEIPNSKKAGPDKTVPSTRQITFVARFPTEYNRLALLKACEDESLFINTGSYPPPPPKLPEPPKKTPAPATPSTTAPSTTTKETPSLPGLPTLPETPPTSSSSTPATDLFPIVVLPGNPADTTSPALPVLPDLSSTAVTPETKPSAATTKTEVKADPKPEVKK